MNPLKYIQNLFAKRYHWYEVKYIYIKRPNSVRIFDWVAQVGITKRSDILIHRKIKTILPPLHKRKDVPKYLLCNGRLEVEAVCYLGKFKSQNKNN